MTPNEDRNHITSMVIISGFALAMFFTLYLQFYFKAYGDQIILEQKIPRVICQDHQGAEKVDGIEKAKNRYKQVK